MKVPVLCLCLIGGCQLFVDDADRAVYRMIEARQEAGLGESRSARIDEERVPIHPGAEAYDFVPHPTDPSVPASFNTARPPASAPAMDEVSASTTRPAESGLSRRPADLAKQGWSEEVSRAIEEDIAVASQPADVDLQSPDAGAEVLTLAEALAYAFAHSREFQTAKEDLYLAALDLSLERHLWTPQLVGEISSQYANFGQIRNFDHAMDAVSRVGVEQRLPYGGQITAEIVSSLMRDLTNRITTGETGDLLLRADIPLLRGAGKVAYESRYQAERDLIYAVRAFERFRRVLSVDIAADYFNLQQLRQQIDNTDENIAGLTQLFLRSRALWRAGRIEEVEMRRSEQDRLTGLNDRVDAIERFQTAMDEFKIRIGMPTETNVTIEQAMEIAGESETRPAEDTPASTRPAEPLVQAIAMPSVSEEEAIRTALKYRLDLINDLDRIGDAYRGVDIAQNNLLPALDAFGSVAFDTDPTRLGMFDYNSERATWRTGLNLELPLDRKAERNALRESLIGKRRAERRYDEARDRVRLQVRRAMRQVLQQEQSLQIQIINRDLARKRLRSAEFLYNKGRVLALEVTDAQEALLEAQNRLAAAQADLKIAILAFWRDSETLRIDDEGKWVLAVGNPAPEALR